MSDGKIISHDEYMAKLDALSDIIKDMALVRDIKDLGLSAEARIARTPQEAYKLKDYEDYMKGQAVFFKLSDLEEGYYKANDVIEKLIEDKINRIFE